MKKFRRETYTEADQKPLGRGFQKEVFVSPDDPEKVIGIYKEYAEETPEEVKARFYLTKILHFLYPHNIPALHLSASRPQVIVVQRVHENVGHQAESDSLKNNLFELGVSLDTKLDNFIATGRGDVWYTDTIRPWLRYGRKNYDGDKIREAILKLDEDTQAQAFAYLARLEQLYVEAHKNK